MSAEFEKFKISRTFNAPRELVWKLHTECEHLKNWWGPKGFVMTHCKVDLQPGGIFHYGMCPANNESMVMWGRFVFREVDRPEKLVYVVSFSDENAGITRHPLSETWPLEVLNTTEFSEEDGRTTVTISGFPINATDEEIRTFEVGRDSMRQGFKGTYDHFEDYLATVRQAK
jgi:uncharacterized protein YndB with AHSA1/START domain